MDAKKFLKYALPRSGPPTLDRLADILENYANIKVTEYRYKQQEKVKDSDGR